MLLVIAAALAAPARGQTPAPPETMAAAQELADMFGGGAMTQIQAAIVAQVWAEVERQLGDRASAGARAKLRREFELAVADVTAQILQDAPAIYARHFSTQELRDMLAFYKSPTGAKALKEMPLVLADVSQTVAPRLQAVQGTLATRVDAIMRQHGYRP
jgi:hypothetical protein